MAKWKVQSDVGMETYSDGDVENIIYQYAKDKTDIRLLPTSELNYPIIYHLSEVRENILNWYPFKKGAVVLEMGAGCGALTGCLCERAEKVVSMDISERRSRINFTRHQQYDNLEVIVGNINRIEFEEPFDYIVINGVLEYAAMFTEGPTPYETCLKHLMKYLKPCGKVLIAIENKLGIKYFAGSPEDHTNEYFTGLNGYVNSPVKTFGKNELEELLGVCGFRYTKFYYPYPDYKFPTEMFTAGSIDGYGNRPMFYLQDNHYQLFDIGAACDALKQEQMMEQFANSFLVEAGLVKEEQHDEVLYVKLNQDRAERFRIATAIKTNVFGKKYVEKQALHPDAVPHIQKMASVEHNCGDFEIVLGLYDEKKKSVRYPYIEGKNLQEEITEILEEKEFLEEDKIVRILHILDAFVNACRKRAVKTEHYATEEFRRVFGDRTMEQSFECLCPANVDLILSNVFYAEGRYQVIDPEWIFDFPVPVDFIIWRALNELLEGTKEIEKLFGCNMLMERYGIGEVEQQAMFRSWADHFVVSYVEGNTLAKWNLPVLQSELCHSKEEIVRWKTVVELYYSSDETFDEMRRMYYETEVSSGKFRVKFNLKGLGATLLRFDPAICSCRCRLNRVWVDKGEAETRIRDITHPMPLVEAEIEEWYEFCSEDPQYLIKLTDSDVELICIEGELAV